MTEPSPGRRPLDGPSARRRARTPASGRPAVLRSTARPSDSEGGGDPWMAFGYLVAGVAVYGGLGWGLATWLHAAYLTPIGIVVGAVLGLVGVVYQTGLFSGAATGSTSSSGQPAIAPPSGNPPVTGALDEALPTTAASPTAASPTPPDTAGPPLQLPFRPEHAQHEPLSYRHNLPSERVPDRMPPGQSTDDRGDSA